MSELDRYLTKNVIFQYLRERRNGRKNQRVGILFALRSVGSNEVFIGFSKCHIKDKFNLLDGLKMAEFRATDFYNPNNPEIPKKHIRDLDNFVKRSKRYFKDWNTFHSPTYDLTKCYNEKDLRDKIVKDIKEDTYTECHKFNASGNMIGKFDVLGSMSGGDFTELEKANLERTRKMFAERRERVKKNGEKDLMPEMLDKVMKKIKEEEKTSTECHKDDKDYKKGISLFELGISNKANNTNNTHTECSCKCNDKLDKLDKLGDMSDEARKEWAKTELEREKESFSKKFNLSNDLLNDSFRDKGLDYDVSDKFTTYMTNARIMDLNNRLKELEVRNVSNSNWLSNIDKSIIDLKEQDIIKVNWLRSINNTISKLDIVDVNNLKVIDKALCGIIDRLDKLEVIHKVKATQIAEDISNDVVRDYAYVIRHTGRTPLEGFKTNYKGKYLDINGGYTSDLEKARKYVNILTATDAIEDELMDGYEEVVRVKRIRAKWWKVGVDFK